MDNMHGKKHKKYVRHSAVDGFLRQPEKKPAHDKKSTPGFSFNRSYKPLGQQKVDNFKLSDGFHPAGQPKIAPVSTATTASSTILPDRPLPKETPNRHVLDPALPTKRGSLKDLQKPPRRHRLRKIMKRVALVALFAIIITGGLLFAKFWKTQRQVLTGTASRAAALDSVVDPTHLKHEGDGRINILLAATSEDDKNHGGADLTDSIMIVSIDPSAKTAVMVSIPRDFWVKFDGKACPAGYEGKINAVYPCGEYLKFKEDGYAEGGMGFLEKIVYQTFGIPVHYYAKTNYAPFKQVVDTVGGIDITLDSAIYDPNFDWQYGKNALKLPAGPNHLSGTQALLLARSRNANGGYGTGNDFARTENQRKMLLAIKEKALSTGTISNPLKLYKLMDSFGTNIRTDMGKDDISALYQVAKDIDVSAISSVGLEKTGSTQLIKTDFYDTQSIIRPTAGMYDYLDIKKFFSSILKDGLLVSEDAKVAVYNGSLTPGIASTKAEELRSAGYNVVTVANAPTQDYQKTVLVDLTKGVKKYTLKYLEGRLGVKAVTTLPDPTLKVGNADFVILLGANEPTAN
jgi:polyisoprenyl-teichoic acid--peptidoglycan teichoic acid transferase